MSGALPGALNQKWCSSTLAVLVTLQRFDTEAQVIENGIYLGHILSFAFLGPWAMKAVRQSALASVSRLLRHAATETVNALW